ncbi:MAG: hypothetical protein IT261_14760, partial [Saprospiraceae bacterium]|nr:hypothetical protein [Saprospiraceae bacterium]
MKYTQIPALVGAILLTISGIRAQSPDFYFTLDSATAPPNQVVCLHLRAYGFEKIVSLQFAIQWDETIVELAHTQNHALPGWSGGDFFTMSNDCLIGGWTEPVGLGYSIP